MEPFGGVDYKIGGLWVDESSGAKVKRDRVVLEQEGLGRLFPHGMCVHLFV